MIKRKGFVKKLSIKDKISFLEDNLAVIESQRHINAIAGMGGMYASNKELSEEQVMYLDILINNVKKIRGE